MSKVDLKAGDALLVVDVQNDFVTGSLAVRGAPEIIPVLNRYLAVFARHTLPVLATRDWHPPDHCSFHAQGGPWPPHCVAGTTGAAFAPGLALPAHATIVSKATAADRDAYSGFAGSDLGAALRSRGIVRLFVGGLATDYCVLNTVRDARQEGFDVLLLTDAIRAVDVHPGDGANAQAAMRDTGAAPITLAAIEAGSTVGGTGAVR